MLRLCFSQCPLMAQSGHWYQHPDGHLRLPGVAGSSSPTALTGRAGKLRRTAWRSGPAGLGLMANSRAQPLQPAGAGASAGRRVAATCKDRTGEKPPSGAVSCSSPAFCFVSRIPSPCRNLAPGRLHARVAQLNGGTRSLRAAALPFPPAFSLMPVRPFCPHGEELGETSHETTREKQHVTAERQHHGFRI